MTENAVHPLTLSGEAPATPTWYQVRNSETTIASAGHDHGPLPGAQPPNVHARSLSGALTRGARSA